MDNRFRSGGIGESETVYMYLYPNHGDLVNQIEDSGNLWFIASARTSFKTVICSKISPTFDGVPATDSLPDPQLSDFINL